MGKESKTKTQRRNLRELCALCGENRGEMMTRFIITVVLVMAVCAGAYADTVILKNGGKLIGRVVRQDRKEVTIEIGDKGWTMTISRRLVKEIKKDDRTEPDVLPPSTSAVIPTSPKEKKPEEEPGEDGARKPPASKPAKQEKKKKPLDPELKKRIKTLISQLGLGSKKHRGRRNNAIAKLQGIGEPAVPALIRALQGGGTPKQRWGAAKVLGNIGDERATVPLIAQLRNSDQWVRKHSAEALRKITRQNFGYNFDADAGARAGAVSKWEEWWKKKLEEEEKKKAEEEKKRQEEAEAAKKKAEEEAEAAKKEAEKEAGEEAGEEPEEEPEEETPPAGESDK